MLEGSRLEGRWKAEGQSQALCSLQGITTPTPGFHPLAFHLLSCSNKQGNWAGSLSSQRCRWGWRALPLPCGVPRAETMATAAAAATGIIMTTYSPYTFAAQVPGTFYQHLVPHTTHHKAGGEQKAIIIITVSY